MSFCVVDVVVIKFCFLFSTNKSIESGARVFTAMLLLGYDFSSLELIKIKIIIIQFMLLYLLRMQVEWETKNQLQNMVTFTYTNVR